MKNPTRLTNQFLVAMPDVEDPYFDHAVTLICEHNDQGAMGIIINQPLNINISQILHHLDIQLSDQFNDQTVCSGGPVHTEVGLILHPPQGQWESSIILGDELCLTSSRDILNALAEGRGPENIQLVLGYAGWGPGQLEQELLDNAWLTTPASAELVFNTPHDQRWTQALQSLGIDRGQLSIQIGHA